MIDMNLEEALNQVGLTAKRTKSGYPTSLSDKALEVSKKVFKATKHINENMYKSFQKQNLGQTRFTSIMWVMENITQSDWTLKIWKL